MSKLCKSCGQYYDGDFCDKCGYGNPELKTKAADKYKKPSKPKKFRTEEDQKLYEQWEKEKRDKRTASNSNVKFLIIVAVVVVGVIFAVLIKTGAIFSRDKKDVIKNYFEAVQSGDFNEFVKCFPKEIKNSYLTDLKESGYSEEEYMKEYNKDFKESYGDDYKISVKFGKETKLDKDDYDMSEYKKAYGSAPNISEAYEIVVYTTFKGSKGSEDAKLYLYVGKCSGGWKIFNLTQDNGIIDKSMELKDTESVND